MSSLDNYFNFSAENKNLIFTLSSLDSQNVPDVYKADQELLKLVKSYSLDQLAVDFTAVENLDSSGFAYLIHLLDKLSVELTSCKVYTLPVAENSNYMRMAHLYELEGFIEKYQKNK